jgi:predicted DsbA family dithiol-disulfide isomerase
MQSEKYDMMHCDTTTGICEIPRASHASKTSKANKPVKLLYFTDPICSSCWGIEPQLRKLKQEYGDYFDIEYRMGGLLKSWSEYGGTDVNGPQSVAKHWEEAGTYYDMPIDGDVWNEDPLHSSYPPATAYKAAQLQGNYKADQFLRRLKEMVFTEKLNITKPEHLLTAAKDAGLDPIQFEYDYRHKAGRLFEEDLLMAREWGVRGFPTIFFIDADDNRFKVYGSKPYQAYEQALLKLVPGNAVKNMATSFDSIFNGYDSVTLKEFAVFYDKSLKEAESILEEFEKQKKVKRTVFKGGNMWKVANKL